MRLLSWNINGIRTLPQYHPWNTFKECELILNEIGADIICFQEMKSSRAALPRDVAIPPSYASFFSFPITKGGYSGVAIYTKAPVLPLKAEEGLSGRLQPKTPLTTEESVSSSYPSASSMELFPDEEGSVPATFDALDAEGRALVVDFGLFVLINTYCPNETSDERLPFKMNYHLLLEERVRKLMEEGREVIVVGDINICAQPIDHCDGHLSSNANNFYQHPARAWFHEWLEPQGPMVDVVRKFWPDRKGMFTVWNQRLQARETNYGTRVDYILVSRGLCPWIKDGDIQPSVKGSDHCPIFIDFYDEIVDSVGQVVKLQDVLKQTDGRKEPRLAARNWEEYSGKQKLLSAFFGKGKGEETAESSMGSSPAPSIPKEIDVSQDSLDCSQNKSSARSLSSPLQPSSSTQPSASPSTSTVKITPASDSTTKKRLKPDGGFYSSSTNSVSTSKKKKTETGQASISIFFKKPPTISKSSSGSKVALTEVIDVNDDTEGPAHSTTAPSGDAEKSETLSASQLDADFRLALAIQQEDTEISSFSSLPTQSQRQSKQAWSTLFTPIQPPRCTVHNEPSKKYTVNKPGPNKGRVFYLCSRPVGPGYDKGRGERLREEVDHQWRCNFFKWASDVKREGS